MDTFHQFNGSVADDQHKKSITSPHQGKNRWEKMGCEEKNAAVNEEINRMNQLPANSSYATNHLRVLNKIKQLLSIKRTTSQEEELQLLFAGLSL